MEHDRDSEGIASAGIDRLGIDDVNFLISSLIARCPRRMMLRELVMNAMESAAEARADRRVDILGINVAGVRKLGVRNTGPGMSRDELFRMCDLGTSIRKIKNLSANFGMGGKLASLGSNPLGVRYRSCCQCRVYEVTLGLRNGRYGRVFTRSRTGFSDITDVTEIAKEAGVLVDTDWTEVVLYGSSPEQDTVLDPHGDGSSDPGWIVDTLGTRFYDTLPGVRIYLAGNVFGVPDEREFQALNRLSPIIFERREAVQVEENVIVHFAKIASSQKLANFHVQGGIALLHRNELFEFETGPSWAYNAPAFGVSFEAKSILVLIELGERFPIVAEQYREFFHYSNNPSSRVAPRDFAALVRQSAPLWLIDHQAKHAAALRADLSFKRSLVDLAERLNSSCEFETVEPARVYMLRDSGELKDRWLDARAARYEMETNELFINSTYPSIGLLAKMLLDEFATGSPDSSRLEELAVQFAEDAISERIACTVLRVLYRARSPNWTRGNRERALSGEALSLVADDIETLFMARRDELIEKMHAEKLSARSSVA